MPQIPQWAWGVMIAAVFAVVFGVGQGFYWTWKSRRQAEHERLARRLGTTVDEADESALFRDLSADAAAASLGGVGQHLQDVLVEGEVNWSVGQLLIYSSIAAGGVALALFLFVGPAAILVGFITGFVPYFIVRQKAEARSRKLLEQLPEALDLMARSLQAGLGLSDAFKMCAEELPLPIAGEFGRVFEEVRFGRDYRTALMGLLDRNPRLFELRMFVSSVL
ncbi:MAG: type II secretion system F family protein, partial [Myxococcota bacterium]